MTSEVRYEGKERRIVCIDILIQLGKLTGLEVRAQAEYTFHLKTTFFSSFSHLSYLISSQFSSSFSVLSLPYSLYSLPSLYKSHEMSRNERHPDLSPVSVSSSLAEITLMYRHQQSAPLSTSRISKSLRTIYDSLEKPSITPNNVDNSKVRLKSIDTKLQELLLPTIEHRSLGR
jgi:hypothetical protein